MSKKYIPIEKVLEKNEQVNRLESQGFIINPNNLCLHDLNNRSYM